MQIYLSFNFFFKKNTYMNTWYSYIFQRLLCFSIMNVHKYQVILEGWDFWGRQGTIELHFCSAQLFMCTTYYLQASPSSNTLGAHFYPPRFHLQTYLLVWLRTCWKSASFRCFSPVEDSLENHDSTFEETSYPWHSNVGDNILDVRGAPETFVKLFFQ